MTTVRVVSVMPFAGSTLEASFKAGLGKNPPTYFNPPLDNLGYNKTTLKAAVQTAATGGNTLVVTVGGLASAIGAKSTGTTIPFISLAGGGGGLGFYSSPFKNFKGGYNLNSVDADTAYLGHLTGPPLSFQRNEIVLLYNTNSIISQIEPMSLPRQQLVTLDQTTVQNGAASAFSTAFNGSPDGTIQGIAQKFPNASAVVVSGDAFIAHWREQLISVANNSNYWILYPSELYLKHRPRKDRSSSLYNLSI